MATNDFTSVSELSGYRVTQEQIARMYTRYRFAADLCVGRDVLEVACGSGQGLGLLAKRAKSVVGGDFDPAIVALAQKHYGDRIPVKQMDAHAIPFADQSLDAVILFEAIYYLRDPLLFFRECKRVLRKGGILVIGSANKEWPGFNPSPFSHTYFSAQELFILLTKKGFVVDLYGDCPVVEGKLWEKAVGWIKKLAVRFHLIPKTMKGKEMLKRIFVGRLVELPKELEGELLPFQTPKSIPASRVSSPDYKVIFAVGKLGRGDQ